MSSALRTLTGLCAALFIGACTSGGGIFSAFESGRPNEPQDTASLIDAANLDAYFDLMDDLLDGDTVIQAEAFQRVNAAEAAASNTTNRLRLAVALAIPGHAGSNAEHAQRELRELLAASELLMPEERILASLLLAQIEQRLLLDLEAEQTQAAAAASMQTQTRELEQRIGQLQDENQSLRRQLEEAQNIIDEITNIERSIRERESAN
ncbi:MAG TPA: hypothetical protein VKQ06_06355 [Gammaproteobacteria bacterium]|nr:hypothetical protein [Gammaproteobacteria bacterium]